MDEAANAGAAAPAQPKSMFEQAVEHFIDLFHLRAPVATPQIEAAENAMMLKARNAHRFAPRHPPHPLSVAGEIGIGAATFVTFNPRFPGNGYAIRRGMDHRTWSAATRGTKRDKNRGYLRANMLHLLAAANAWDAQKTAAGFGQLGVKA